MSRGLKIDPPKRGGKSGKPANTDKPKGGGIKFDQLADTDMVQFNKRVPRSVADGYETLRIQTRRKVPELIAEGLELLQEKYGKV